jgi:flagellar protein FlaJ
MIVFERLVSRGVVRRLSNEIDLAGVKTTVEATLRIMISGAILIFLIVTCVFFAYKFNVLVDVGIGLLGATLYVAAIYLLFEYKIEGRKSQMEEMLPDYLQITSANLRSGVSLDRAMLMAAKPEFIFLSDDVKEMNRRIFGGESFETAIKAFASRYRSYQLSHAVKMILESLRYGGAVADLLQQISKDLRSQQLMQKEIAGQMLMYSIFIVFAGVIVAPALYGLTSQMIKVTATIWTGILAQNPGGLPTAGISFLSPSAPQMSPSEYYNFSVLSIIIITAFASLIVSAVQSGSAVKGVKYAPLFVAIGVGIFLLASALVGSMFTHIGGV